MRSVFSRWGRFVYRHRRAVALISVLLTLASLTLAGRASDQLSSGGWMVRGSESTAVMDRLATEFGAGRSSMIVLFRADEGEATSPEAQAAIGRSLSRLDELPEVIDIVRWTPELPDERFVSRDGTAAYAVVRLDATDEESIDLVKDVRAAIEPQPGLTHTLTGYGPLSEDANRLSEEDLRRAESVSLPLALIILVAVFASLVAAGMPLLVAGLAIPSTLALVFGFAQVTEMSIYVLNVATMLGLALAIDYSLFMVSRFREELAGGRTVADAVERSVATSGKAVLFSGLAVAVGLLGLLFFASPAISSMGIGGSLVVVCSVFYALTFLPAVLGMLGPRVNALSVGSLFARVTRRPRPAGGGAQRSERSGWARVARWVMAHPVAVLVPTLVLLLLAGAPYLGIRQSVPDASVFPAGVPSRDALVALDEEFVGGDTTPYTIIADVPGDPTSPENAHALARYAEAVARLDGVDSVQGPFSGLRDPRTGEELTPEGVRALYELPVSQRPPEMAALAEAYIRDSAVRMDAISSLAVSDPEALELTEAIRGTEPGAGIQTAVGGIAAQNHDTLASINGRTPWAIGTTLLVSAVVLFLLFGSVVLPIKAVLMTLLSITASFGALVWIFQEGNLAGLLGFEPLGYTIAGNPVIMFAVLFGLSMDYEVLLLSRVQEAYRRTGDNRASVAEGLARTASVITGAALIMVTVFAAFALAEIVTIKSIGVGMAIAVFLDATIIRVLLVPATMRLMGRWNWWAPGPLGRLADRLGFSHTEVDEASDHVRQPATA